MTRLLVVCCFSLLLAGVSGDDVTVTVMKGDNVTMLINPKEIEKSEKWLWKFNDKYIATIDLEVNNSLPNNTYIERFRGRLKLDRNTGSLTISNIRTNDTGKYKMMIKMKSQKPKPNKTFSVTVNDEPSTLSVIKGDQVTLKTTGVKIQPDDVQWKFNGKIISNLTHSTITNMDVNHQTGELKISDIGRDQSGEYEVKINASGFIIHRIFRVDVRDEVKSVSVMKEETLTLNTKVKTQAGDVIEWKFKNTPIAKMDRIIDPQPDPVLDGRFRDRLDVNSRGYLIITHIKTNESGFYDVNITNINRSIQKRFSVTVTESSSGSHQVKICPGLFVVVIMLVTALVMPVTGDD